MGNYKLLNIVVCAGVVAAALFMSGWAGRMDKHISTKSDVIVTINGKPMSSLEFKPYVEDSIAETASYFYSRFGVELDGDTWDKPFDGETPLVYLKEKALDKALTTKLEIAIAEELNLMPVMDYSQFMKKLAAENKRRETASQAGQTIFGPLHFNEREYISYLLGALEEKRNELLWEREFRVSDEVLEVHYEKIKDTFFHLGFDIDTEQVYFEDFTDFDVALHSLQSVLEQAKSGQSLLKAVEKENSRSQEQLHYKDQLLANRSTSKEDTRSQEVERIAKLYQTGDFSEIVQWDTVTGFIRIKSKKDLGYIPFAEAKDGVIRHYAEEQYNNLIKQLRSNAQVTTEEEVYMELVTDLLNLT